MVLRGEPVQELEQAIVFRPVTAHHRIYNAPAPQCVGGMSLVLIREPHTAVRFDHLNECPESKPLRRDAQSDCLIEVADHPSAVRSPLRAPG